MTKLLCAYCFEPIATIKVNELSVPFKPEMFKSIDSVHEIPPPFPEGVEWIDMKCPICKLRPFYSEDRITIQDDSGKRDIKISDGFKCDICGNIYQHESSLIRHKKEKHG